MDALNAYLLLSGYFETVRRFLFGMVLVIINFAIYHSEKMVWSIAQICCNVMKINEYVGLVLLRFINNEKII